jgi:hypothetical protein
MALPGVLMKRVAPPSMRRGVSMRAAVIPQRGLDVAIGSATASTPEIAGSAVSTEAI